MVEVDVVVVREEFMGPFDEPMEVVVDLAWVTGLKLQDYRTRHDADNVRGLRRLSAWRIRGRGRTDGYSVCELTR